MCTQRFRRDARTGTTRALNVTSKRNVRSRNNFSDSPPARKQLTRTEKKKIVFFMSDFQYRFISKSTDFSPRPRLNRRNEWGFCAARKTGRFYVPFGRTLRKWRDTRRGGMGKNESRKKTLHARVVYRFHCFFFWRRRRWFVSRCGRNERDRWEVEKEK